MKLPKIEKQLVLQYVVYSCTYFIAYAVSTALMGAVYEPQSNWFRNVIYIGCGIFAYLISQHLKPKTIKK